MNRQEIAREQVAPTILKLLKGWSAQDLTIAIVQNRNLVQELKSDREYHRKLILYTSLIPDIYGIKSKLANALKKQTWIDWFIDNEMAHNRKDLYLVIEFNRKARPYLYKQIRGLVNLLLT